MARVILAAVLAHVCAADVYLHMPRGSNNRVNEQNTNRQNNNRLFDSQNNNKGGYSVGVDDDDYTGADTPRPPRGPIVDGDPARPLAITTAGNIGLGGADGNGYRQPPLQLELGSILPVEWTNQHACGPNDKTNCETVIQYMCDATDPAQGAPGLRDGEQTGCPNNNDQCPPLDNDNDIEATTFDTEYGQHEPVYWYQQCRARKRNKGLFTADRNMNNRNNARNTRQNPNGGRSGTECPEERDYYPYWRPTPFRDIAVLTSNISRCNYYVTESQNVKAKGNCSLVEPSTFEECQAEGGTWTEAPSWNDVDSDAGGGGEEAPECMEMFWTRDNHLGNGIGGRPNIFNWTMPSEITHLRQDTADDEDQFDRCVLRLRYNISTGDTGLDLDESIAYWDLDHKYNGDDSPVEQDMPVDVPGAQNAKDAGDAGGGDVTGVTRTLQLALNTNQYGRVFEDRSLVFHVTDFDEMTRRRRRMQQNRDTRLTEDGGLAPYDAEPDDCDVIHNLQIRGKRGNIVQSYPSVEHDFEPSPLVAETGDCVHYIMHLTDNDPPNNAGEGLPGSGRANVVLTETADKNVPVTDFSDPVTQPGNFFESEAQMFRWAYLGQDALRRTDGSPTCLEESEIADNNNEQNVRNCGKLNPVGPYYDAGVVKTATAGKWSYMSTRENNFTNRSHKGSIIIVDGMGTAEVVAIVLAAVAGVALTAAGGTLAFFKLTGKPIPSLPCFGSGAEKAVAATAP